MSKYTPGPWHPLIFKPLDRYEIYSNDVPKNCIAKIDFNTPLIRNEQHEANAKLISAAPELLEVLTEIVEADNMTLLTSFYNKAKAAIKKATE